MWTRNQDTGKWIQTQEGLDKISYDALKQDFSQFRLLSKHLSGAVYLPITRFENIYEPLDQTKAGYYISHPNALLNLPQTGPQIPIQQDEFYNQYAFECGLTLKAHFSPQKAVDDQLRNFQEVDVATTGQLNNLSAFQPLLYIDGVKLVEGNRVLVKDQTTTITLPFTTDPYDYFTSNNVATFSIVQDNVTDITYRYPTAENGIWVYTNSTLVKTNDFATYPDAFRFFVAVRSGQVNAGKQFHLNRKFDGYYPIAGQSINFIEAHAYILRHQVDYNNVLDLNFKDNIWHGQSQIYSQKYGATFSIPARTITVGEFGSIICTQDRPTGNATYSISQIIQNPHKVQLSSIANTEGYYYICGNLGTILKVDKVDFDIEYQKINEQLDLLSISFFTHLYGWAVGKFNTIYWTRNGGQSWTKLEYPELDDLTYLSVSHFSATEVLVGCENGIVVQFQWIGGVWTAYKRQITLDGVTLLVEDVLQIVQDPITSFTPATYSINQNSNEFGESLQFFANLSGQNQLNITIDSNQFYATGFTFSAFGGRLRITNSSGAVIYQNPLWNQNISLLIDFPQLDYFYLFGFTNSYSESIALPTGGNGEVIPDTYTVEWFFNYTWDGISQSPTGSFTASSSFELDLLTRGFFWLTCTDKTLIAYDYYNVLGGSDFIVASFSTPDLLGNIEDIAFTQGTQSRWIATQDGVYQFNRNEFLDTGVIVTTKLLDTLANAIAVATSSIFLAGNYGVMEYSQYGATQSYEMDITYGDDFRSSMLFLDYDIASKLNFIDDFGNYRLPNSVTFSYTNTNLVLSSPSGQTNWLDYWKGIGKVFAYSTTMSTANQVLVSSTFRYFNTAATFSVTSAQISDSPALVAELAPSITSTTASRFFGPEEPPTNYNQTTYKAMFWKWLALISVPFDVQVGDVLRLKSTAVEGNVVVNRIERWVNGVKATVWPTLLPGNAQVATWVWCYTDFNENIIRNLKRATSPLLITNLNLCNSSASLVENFNLHPVGIGYDLEVSDSILKIAAKFNPKTAYYNMATQVQFGATTKQMEYTESFLRFGYKPEYNLLDYLNKIDPAAFTGSKVFTILPEYFNLPGNNGNSFATSSIYIDPSVGTQSYGANKIIFGDDLKFVWDSLLEHTFIDMTLYDGVVSYPQTKFLITKKYQDPTETATTRWVMEFHKKIDVPSAATIDAFDLLSRNTLQEISDDLKELNNIHRPTSSKSIQYLQTFSVIGSEIKTKFSTNSYYLALASDWEIRKYISNIIWSDSQFRLALGVINLDSEIEYDFSGSSAVSSQGFANKLRLDITGEILIGQGDFVFIQMLGGAGSSEFLNPQYNGYHTVIEAFSDPFQSWIVLSVDFGVPTQTQDVGKIKWIKRDPFLNFAPIDLFDFTTDRILNRSIAIYPDNVDLVGSTYNLVNVDLNNYRFELVDGLSIAEVTQRYSWLLEAEVDGAIIGRNESGLVWYSGIWYSGRWFGGTWISGEWITGDWYDGSWKSHNIEISTTGTKVRVDDTYVDNRASRWYNGRWFGGTWSGGTWYNGRFYGGNWAQGVWYNGIWNDGVWADGSFRGGVWVLGQWQNGQFNCNSRRSYWLDGQFRLGDFENGVWYNGEFGILNRAAPRFGINSSLARPSIWHAGTWYNGEFHSILDPDPVTGLPTVSAFHNFSVWRTGVWYGGDFWGGIAYSIDFRGGTWHGGVLLDIQVTGIDRIYPATQSTNSIVVNGLFKFNVGDFIHIIDNSSGLGFAQLGSNSNPGKYRINRILEDEAAETTRLYLNYDLSSLGVEVGYGQSAWDGYQTGLRVVSYFNGGDWQSGIWTNGIFDGGNLTGGIWYNGVFMNGNWGL